MLRTPLADAAFALFGGYLILWFAFLPEASRLINNETDISYGTYLYAWPIQNALICTGHPNPLIILPLALVGATICEYLLDTDREDFPAEETANHQPGIDGH